MRIFNLSLGFSCLKIKDHFDEGLHRTSDAIVKAYGEQVA